MRVLLLLAHSIEEYDQLRLLHEYGYDVFSIGAYTNPHAPSDTIRPPLPEVPHYPDLEAACHAHRVEMTERNGDVPAHLVDWAKFVLPQAVLDWADVIICHHFEHTWLVPQWRRIRDKRVIWRTVGQSVAENEQQMRALRDDGLQIVRYSPKERNIPNYAGEDALIRFYKDPDEWTGWDGDERAIINITQGLKRRDPFTNFGYWDAVDCPDKLALGPGSEDIGGPGVLSYDEMRGWLRRARGYIYTGTQPASYTLGLIEAMMTGIPVFSIGPSHMGIFPYGHLMFEGHEIAADASDDPADAAVWARRLLDDREFARDRSQAARFRAVELFDKAAVGAAWREFLG